MDVFDKAKEELRKYLLDNKEQVVKDLDEMRKKSTGDDIYKYIEVLVNNGFLHDVIVSVCDFTKETSKFCSRYHDCKYCDKTPKQTEL